VRRGFVRAPVTFRLWVRAGPPRRGLPVAVDSEEGPRRAGAQTGPWAVPRVACIVAGSEETATESLPAYPAPKPVSANAGLSSGTRTSRAVS
jgi:hypothetical protein